MENQALHFQDKSVVKAARMLDDASQDGTRLPVQFGVPRHSRGTTYQCTHADRSQPYQSTYWLTQEEVPGCFRFLPDLSIHLLFDLSGLIDVEPFLVASNDRYVDLAVPAGAQLVGLQFAVWDALWFREGPGLDRTTFAVSFDIHWAYTLYFTLLDVHNQGSAVAEVGQHVPPFSPWINRALQKGFSPYSSQIIRYAQSDLAPAYSDRHLRRLYQRLAGISPKKFYAILRFQHAAQRIYAERRLSWDGYSDQSHFTREFKALSGMTPAAFLRDYVP